MADVLGAAAVVEKPVVKKPKPRPKLKAVKKPKPVKKLEAVKKPKPRPKLKAVKKLEAVKKPKPRPRLKAAVKKLKAVKRPKGAFTCPKCRRKFSYKMHLSRHINASHTPAVASRSSSRLRKAEAIKTAARANGVSAQSVEDFLMLMGLAVLAEVVGRRTNLSVEEGIGAYGAAIQAVRQIGTPR